MKRAELEARPFLLFQLSNRRPRFYGTTITVCPVAMPPVDVVTVTVTITEPEF